MPQDGHQRTSRPSSASIDCVCASSARGSSAVSPSIAMFKKLNIPILGIIENMSYYVCPHCGVREDIFGHGGAKGAADRLGVPFLGEIPLDPKIRIQSDAGRPVALDLNSPLADAYEAVAKALADQVSRAGDQVPQIITE